MKIPSTLTGIVLLACFFSCRKIKPHDLPENGLNMPAYCANGIQDGDEEYVDCGGSCSACEHVVAPCSTTLNTVSFSLGSPSFPTVTYTSAQITTGVTSGAFHITADDGNTKITFTFLYDHVIANQIHHVADAAPVLGDEVSITINKPFYPAFSAYSGDVYINYADGKLVLDFCGVNIGSGSTSLTMTGDITVN